MATLRFTSTDHRVFTPVSAALGALSAGPGTMVVLVKQTVNASGDFAGLTSSADDVFYHGLIHAGGGFLLDDDDVGSAGSTSTSMFDATNWWLYAVDWSASLAVENFHWRNQTTLSAWNHELSSGTGPAARAGPGTGGFLRIGYIGDGASSTKDQAFVAIWAGTRFSNGDYGLWTKTSDLYNHALGHPTFLCELNATTPADLTGASTYSSANSSGATLVGSDPDNWSFDGVGAVVPPNRLKRWRY